MLSGPPLRGGFLYEWRSLDIVVCVCLHVSMNRGIPSPNNKTHTHTHNPRQEMKIPASERTHKHTDRDNGLYCRNPHACSLPSRMNATNTKRHYKSSPYLELKGRLLYSHSLSGGNVWGCFLALHKENSAVGWKYIIMLYLEPCMLIKKKV